MKILVLSNTPWSIDNSFGNSFSNIFGGIEGLEFANIYCRYGEPHNNIVNRYFQITEKSLLRNLTNKNCPSGSEVLKTEQSDLLNVNEEKLFNHARKNRFQIYFWLRNLVWKIGRWKSIELKKFISDFNPDIIFQPVYYSTYLNDIALFIKEYTNAPMLCYVSDDVYTLRQFSLSPFYWINRFIVRRKVRKVIKSCEILYVISDIQKREYEKCFNKECRILTKGADFTEEPYFKNSYNKPLILVYTGNIGGSRWRMLEFIGRSLKLINAEGIKAKLLIYTMTPITNKMRKKLSIDNCVSLMGGVPSSEVAHIQKDADILVHVESFSLKERLQVHQSLSTKIVDYFAACKCIFAVGSMDMASINYLSENDAAVIATSKKEILEKIIEITNNSHLIHEYAQKAWECGKCNHQIDTIQSLLYNDLNTIIRG